MISNLIKIPFLKRIIPSLGIKILKFLKKNRGYFMIENTSMFLDFLDPIDREIILNQKFENKEITDLLHLMKKYSIKTFFDLGANCGYYSIKVLKEISEVKVIAFEPNKEAYSKFNKTILVNSQFSKNIKIENFGLSNQNALLKMKFLKKYDYNQTGGSSVISDFDINEKNFFYATFKIGDEILDFKNQKLCFKIDVERHEINVIQGLKKTLKDNDSLILIEIYKKNFYEIDIILKGLGFNQIKKFKERSNYLYSNFIN
jgi:FkbM family methyltransferase